jgi:SAM-dependent methyltransferase
MLDPGVLGYVRESLPPAPLRVLEVGAGSGELAAELASVGYEVVAIDPASIGDPVRPIPLVELPEPPESFDAAVAVVSLHHVEPLRESCRRLAEVVRPGGTLVLDEIDAGRFDERAASWWLEHRDADGHEHGGHEHAGPGHGEHEPGTPEEIVAFLRRHIHDLATLQDTLGEWFELGPPVRGPYLYRWELPPGLRATEVRDIGTGRLPAVGVRIVGARRPGPA